MAAGWRTAHAAVGAAGAILHYLRDTQRAALEHLDRPTYYDRAEYMVLDAVTVRNLEMVEPMFAGEGETLLGVLDQTMTGMGGRLLRQRLLRPSLDRAEIEARLDAVGELLQQTILRAELRKELSGILDLERLLAKITMGTAGPRELLALGRSLDKLPEIEELLRDAAGRAAAQDLRSSGRGAGGAQPRSWKRSPTSRRSTSPTAAPSAPASTPSWMNCAT